MLTWSWHADSDSDTDTDTDTDTSGLYHDLYFDREELDYVA